MAVSTNHYNDFLPFETDEHLLIAIGGPVLYFIDDNHFLTEPDSSIATEQICHRWLIDKKMRWDDDLSGPFTVLLINKLDHSSQPVTDLMSFIPVYSCQPPLPDYMSGRLISYFS